MSLIQQPQPLSPDVLTLDLPKSKDHASRVNQYIQWLKETRQEWHTAPLVAYAEYLKGRNLTPASINAHLSTIRGQYRRLMNNQAIRDIIGTLAYELLAIDGFEANPANQKAYKDEIIGNLERAIDPDRVKVKATTKQDTPDGEHIRLTFEQSNTLLSKVDRTSVIGVRDYALMFLMLATGIRESEAAALTISDLRHKIGGEWCLLVREGKGSKQRAIPYGANIEVLAAVDEWLELLKNPSPDSPVFRGVNKGGNIQSEALTTRTIQRILDSYPVVIEGKSRQVKPHDLRRTYARLCWEMGMDLVAIQQNLGHADVKTTLGYIGELDTSNRAPKKTGFHFTPRPKYGLQVGFQI